MKFGRVRPPTVGAHLKLKNYLRRSLPSAPTSCDYSALPAAALADVMANDELGDCVIAGGYHALATFTGNAGDLYHASRDQVIADYEAIGGYKPGDPSTDNGCDLQTALNYWVTKGFRNGTKLMGWLGVDASDPAEVQAACFLFENLYFGMELPALWVGPFPSGNGYTWDVAGAPVPTNGHCVFGCGYDSRGVKIDSWGMLGTLTYAAIKQYATLANGGELYVMLSPDQLAKGQTRAPNGVDWTALIADWNSIGGHVPSPTLPPSPAPTPDTPPTLAQAVAWAEQGLAGGHAIMSRAQAISLASKGLASGWPAP